MKSTHYSFCLFFTESTQQPVPSRCLVHLMPIETTILPWQPDKWTIVTRAAEARKNCKNFQTSKYRAVIEALPSDLGENDGYYSKWYKNFTAIQLASRPIHGHSCPERKILRSESSSSACVSHISSTSSRVSTVGIFPDTCLFL